MTKTEAIHEAIVRELAHRHWIETEDDLAKITITVKLTDAGDVRAVDLTAELHHDLTEEQLPEPRRDTGTPPPSLSLDTGRPVVLRRASQGKGREKL
jgi:hypothetical protein